MRRFVLICASLIMAASSAAQTAQPNGGVPTPILKPDTAGPAIKSSPCAPVTYRDQPYTVCRFEGGADIRTFWSDEAGDYLGSFSALESYIKPRGLRIVMAMNGGMYHADRRPVGLYIEGGNQVGRLQTREGPGNFSMLPNGVFFVKDRRADVMESRAYAAAKIKPDYATQSGPMLVVDGALHPRFKADSTSLRRRNGVGVSPGGGSVYFVISEQAVNFYNFASLMRDELGCPNALYLDGRISRLYDPAAGRMDPGLSMGPMIAVLSQDSPADH